MQLDIMDLGLQPFESTWELQTRLLEQRHDQAISDTLILVEHPPTYTLGCKGQLSDIHFLPKDVTTVHTNRGGEVTCHSPGQLVAYPILDLRKHHKDISWYLELLETVIIDLLQQSKINAVKNPPHRGVWVGNGKIASIGVKLSRWITMHGFAINVTNDLSLFDHITACGLKNTPLVSMNDLLEETPTVAALKPPLVKIFQERFGFTNIRWCSHMKHTSSKSHCEPL